MALVRFTPILPKKANVGDLRQGVRRAAGRTNQLVTQQFERTTRTWRNKPRFTSKIEETGTSIIADTGTESEIYGYVSNGTSIRYAVMTPDFVSKTVPHVVSSRAGAGGLSHFNFRQPRPGIEARRFDDAIVRQQTRTIQRILQEEIDRAVKESGLII